MPLNILHLVGSATNEFYCNLSRLYAQDCLEATANPTLYRFHIAYITPDRRWRFPASLHPEAIAAATPLSLAQAVQVINALNIQVMLPQMFCIPGMTSYRALFDLLHIPYVGNSAGLMALAANKSQTKAVVAAAGVRIPTGELLRSGDRPTLVPPVVIKPVQGDNSLGVVFVQCASEYDAALEQVFSDADEVLVETFVELGREVRGGAIVQGGKLVCLPLEEYAMDRQERPIRRYDDKLKLDGKGGLAMVAKGNAKSWIVDPSDPVTVTVWEAVQKCHVALGCRHYSLFDFRIDPSGQPWFLEAGLYCSFAQTSVISTMARTVGIPLDRLFHSMIKNALNLNRFAQ